MPLQNKVFVITGAASGIARAVAQLLTRQGAMLSLADLNEVVLEQLADELEGKQRRNRPLTTKLDVRSQEACEAWVQSTVSHFGQNIYGAVNLAGVISPSIRLEHGAIRNISDSEFDFVMDVNVKGTLNCPRAQLSHMICGEEGRNEGSIVNAASIAGLVGVERNGPCVAAKHAIIGLTRTLAKEEGSRAIRVNAIAPGLIDTPIMTQIESIAGTSNLFGSTNPAALERNGDAQEVAHVVVCLLSPESSFVNGTVIPVDGGWMC